MFISSISYPNCSSLYLLDFHLILKLVVILLYFYYMCVLMLKRFIVVYNSGKIYNIHV